MALHDVVSVMEDKEGNTIIDLEVPPVEQKDRAGDAAREAAREFLYLVDSFTSIIYGVQPFHWKNK